MAYKKSADIFDISRSMFKYPWLEYPERTKELRKAMAPVHLPLSCYQMPKEEFPPSPECWRQHPSKPHSVPHCYFKKPEIYTHWHILYNQRQEREAQKMLWKMRDHPRQLKEDTPIQKFHLPMSKLTIKSQMGSKPSDPTGDPLKWQRLKDLTKSLESPREHEQFYAAQALGCLGVNDKFIMEALWQVAQTGPEKVKYEACRSLAMLGCLNKHVIQVLIKQLKGQNEEQRMDSLTGLRAALNTWASVPKDKRTQIPFLCCLTLILLQAMRQAVAETVEELKMKPTMMNLVEAQLMNSNATARQEAVISLGVLGIRSPKVFHLLLDMLDAEKSQAVKKSLEETLTLVASIDPWIRNKLKNKVLFVYEALKTNEEAGPTRFRKEPENLEELKIQDFQLVQLNPLFIAKSRATSDLQKKSGIQKESAFYLSSAFLPHFSKPKHKAQATGPWVPKIRKQLQILAKTSK
eukprot:XP_013971964.1 protein HEATR9 [Canis lupus familiaris]